MSIFLSLVCATIYAAPSFVFECQLGNAYKGINFMYPTDVPTYMATVREVQEGYLTHASPYLFEYKNQPTVILEYSEILLGLTMKLLKTDVVIFFKYLQFISACLVFFLIYYFSFLLLEKRTAALGVASSVMLGVGIYASLFSFRNPHLFFDLLQGHGSYFRIYSYDRLLNPLFTYIFFYAGLCALYALFKDGGKKCLLAYAVLLAVNIYMYLYFWTFLFVVSGIIFAYALFTQQKSAKGIGLSILLAGIIGLPYIYSITHLLGSSSGTDFGINIRLYLATHTPIREMSLLLSLALIVASLAYKRIFLKENHDIADAFVFTLLIAGVICSNQQVITGREIQAWHYYAYTNIPMAFLGLWYSFDVFLKKGIPKKFGQVCFIAAIIFIFFFGIQVRRCFYASQFDYYYREQKYGQVISWLNQNSEKDSVVLANSDVSTILPVMTSNNVYFSNQAATHIATAFQRREDAVLVYWYLYTRTNSLAENKAKGIKDMFMMWLYEAYNFREVCKNDPACPYYKQFDNLLAEKDNAIKSISDFRSLAFKYRLDYLLWDKSTDPEWKLNDFDFIRPVYQTGDVVLYKII